MSPSQRRVERSRFMNLWLAVASVLDIGATATTMPRRKKRKITTDQEAVAADWDRLAESWSKPPTRAGRFNDREGKG
jgi:hypothetical protein